MTTYQLFSTKSSPTLAFLLTWMTHGTWAPGLRQGWTEGDKQDPSQANRGRAISLTLPQRELVEQALRECCKTHGWSLIATNCRSNHAHAMVNAAADPQEILRQLQATSSQRLSEAGPPRETWWEAGGNLRALKDENGLDAATFYIRVILQRM